MQLWPFQLLLALAAACSNATLILLTQRVRGSTRAAPGAALEWGSLLRWACSLCCDTEGLSLAWSHVLRVSLLFCSLSIFPPIPFPPGITKLEQGGLGYSAGSLLPPPAPAADLLLISKVAWVSWFNHHLCRRGSSPCAIALISCGNCMSSLACGCCYLFSMLSLAKLLFSRRAVFASFLLPGRSRVIRLGSWS